MCIHHLDRCLHAATAEINRRTWCEDHAAKLARCLQHRGHPQQGIGGVPIRRNGGARLPGFEAAILKLSNAQPGQRLALETTRCCHRHECLKALRKLDRQRQLAPVACLVRQRKAAEQRLRIEG